MTLNDKFFSAGLDDSGMIKFVSSALKKIKKDGTVVVSLVSGAGAGGTTLAQNLVKVLPKADFIGTDDVLVGDRKFRRDNIEGKDPLLKYDIEYLKKEVKAICSLKEGEEILVPTYDEKTGLALGAKNFTHRITQLKYLIVEGDFQFLRDTDCVIYYDVPDEVRLQNRLVREIERRNETNTKDIQENFKLRQKLQHVPHTEPVKERADMIIKVEAQARPEGGFIYKYSIYLKSKK